MRCRSCNRILTDFEATRKYQDMTFVDMCNSCFKSSGYKQKVIERADLRFEEDPGDYINHEDYLND
jgi:hypothetical protein